MNEKQLLAQYGLKWNPFGTNLPVNALWPHPALETFVSRTEALVMGGGFALITGESGVGKSKALQLLSHRLSQVGDACVAVVERPQSNLGDFYRELGERYGVNLSPANRYGGFQALRDKWRTHIKSTLFRPILLIDEAQEVSSLCLNELRLLGSVEFDSHCILTTVLCGDERLPARFSRPDLLPLGSRIRTRLHLERLLNDELIAYLNHSLEQAGASQLMTSQLKQVLADHCAGNLRILTHMASEILVSGAERQVPILDEKLYLEVFTRTPRSPSGTGRVSPKERSTAPRRSP